MSALGPVTNQVDVKRYGFMAPGLTDFWGDYDRVFEKIAQARGLPYLVKSGINGQESRQHALLQCLKDRLNPRMLELRHLCNWRVLGHNLAHS